MSEEPQEIETSIVRAEEVSPAPRAGGMAIFDVDTTMFAAALDRRKANRDALLQWVRSALVKDTDYGEIQIAGRKSKPSLFKPGAEKICGMLGVISTFPNMKDYEQAAVSGVALEHILLRCHLVDGHGNVVAEGAGARTISKEKGDVNKAIKMASKSAHIDATLRMAGLSEIFTQDLEDVAADTEQAKAEREKMASFNKRVDRDWQAELAKAGIETEVVDDPNKCKKCGAPVQEYSTNTIRYMSCTKAKAEYAELVKKMRPSEAKKLTAGHSYKYLGGVKKEGAGTEVVSETAGPPENTSQTPAPSFQSQLEQIRTKVAEKVAKETDGGQIPF